MGRKPPTGTQLELPFGKSPRGKPASSSTWDAVDAFPETQRRAHLRRKKVLKPKLRQDNLEPPPGDD